MEQEKKRRRRWGDRNDGRLLRSIPPIMTVEPFIMPNRNDACNMIQDEWNVDEAERYVREKRTNGLPNFTMLHLVVAAYVRMISQKPALNRFISGQRIYTRDKVEVNLCIKKEMKANSPDSVLSILIDPAATAEDVYHLLDDAITQTRSENTDMDKVANIIKHIPRLLCKFVVWLLRVLDYFGLLPRFLTRLSPFHGSMFITSMASLGLPPIFHHIYNFGNVPVFIAIGRTTKRVVRQKDGTESEQRFMGFSAVLDERICDGYVYATAVRLLNQIIKNPRQLDNPPAQVVEDID